MIITLLVSASITIVVGFIFWYVMLPQTNTVIMVTNENPIPPSIVDIAFSFLPIGVMAFFMMVVIYYGRCSGGQDGI